MKNRRINWNKILLHVVIIQMLLVTGCGKTGNSDLSVSNDNESIEAQENISETEVTVEPAIETPLSEATVVGMTNGNANNYGMLATDGIALYGANYAENGYLSRFDLEKESYRILLEAPVNQINIVGDLIICAKNYDSEEGAIVSIKTDGSEEQVILDAAPAYMRVQDDWIYYCDASTHKMERIKLDGSSHEVLCESACYYISIEGDTLVFQMDGDGERLYRMNTDGSNLQKLTEDAGWYPTCYQNRIYYKAYTATGEYALCSMDMNGGDVKELTRQDVYAMNLLEDMQVIMFSDATDGKLYQIGLDGSDLMEITEYDDMYQADDGTALAVRNAKQICHVGAYTSFFFSLQSTTGNTDHGELARIENSNHMEPVAYSYEGFVKEE